MRGCGVARVSGQSFFTITGDEIRLHRILPHRPTRACRSQDCLACQEAEFFALAQISRRQHCARDDCVDVATSASAHPGRRTVKAQTGAQRVAEFLLSLCDGATRTCSIVLPYEKTLLAGRLGLKPETLSRTFRKLQAVGVEVKSSTVTIKDLRRFARISPRLSARPHIASAAGCRER
jgi:hypothetical protein